MSYSVSYLYYTEGLRLSFQIQHTFCFPELVNISVFVNETLSAFSQTLAPLWLWWWFSTTKQRVFRLLSNGSEWECYMWKTANVGENIWRSWVISMWVLILLCSLPPNPTPWNHPLPAFCSNTSVSLLIMSLPAKLSIRDFTFSRNFPQPPRSSCTPSPDASIFPNVTFSMDSQ